MSATFKNKLVHAETTYTFDDMLLKPLSSGVNREKISLQTSIGDISLTLPFIASAMDTISSPAMARTMAKAGGIAIIHRNTKEEEQAAAVRNVQQENLQVLAAVGPEDYGWALRLQDKTELSAIVLDNAHAHTSAMLHTTSMLRKLFRTVIVGNIATAEAACDLISAGASALKVGIGSGSICKTRIVTGFGVPQLSAIAEVADEASKYGVPILADGGLRNGGDIAKAIAAGASAVVLGNILAGTSDAPGEIIEKAGKKYKLYRGMGSLAVLQGSGASRYNQSYLNSAEQVPEGEEGLVPYKGETEKTIADLKHYLQSSLFYAGASTLLEFRQKTEFVRMTGAGLAESRIHDIFVLE